MYADSGLMVQNKLIVYSEGVDELFTRRIAVGGACPKGGLASSNHFHTVLVVLLFFFCDFY